MQGVSTKIGKIEVSPIGEGPHVTPLKGAKDSRASKLAQRNVDLGLLIKIF
jgi:hypothetical protein